jgi:hypothetical protein
MNNKNLIYSICYENEGTASSVSDRRPGNFIIIKLLNPIFNILPAFIPVGNLSTLTQKFPSVMLPTQGALCLRS